MRTFCRVLEMLFKRSMANNAQRLTRREIGFRLFVNSGAGKSMDTARLYSRSDTALPATDASVKKSPVYINLLM